MLRILHCHHNFFGVTFQNLPTCCPRRTISREESPEFPGKNQAWEPQTSWPRPVLFPGAKCSLQLLELMHSQRGDSSLKAATVKSLQGACAEVQGWPIFVSRMTLRIQNSPPASNLTVPDWKDVVSSHQSHPPSPTGTCGTTELRATNSS